MTQLLLRIDSPSNNDEWRLTWLRDGKQVGEGVDLPAGETRSLVEASNGLSQSFEQPADADGYSRLPLFAPAALETFGEQLLKTCGGAIADKLDGAHAGIGPRLLVHSTLPAALNVPWELLPLGLEKGPVGCDPKWSLYRCPLQDEPIDSETAARPGPLRILFVAAAPEDQAPLDFEKEEEAILNATSDLPGAVLHIAEQGSFAELEELIPRIRPHVVHLSGHGKVSGDGTGTFCFEDEEGHTDSRTAEELVQLFHGSGVECVFLNACQTSQAAVAGLCQALVRAGQPLALGWAASVADDRATNFAETFYRRLLAGEDLPAAVAAARQRIRQEGLRKNALQGGEDGQDATYVLPQLYGRSPRARVWDRDLPEEKYEGPRTQYELLSHGVEGLKEGFVGRRREQQRLIPGLRRGDFTVAVLHGVGGQGKSTLATRVANRLAGDGFAIVALKFQRSTDKTKETAEDCATRMVPTLVDELRRVFRQHKRKDLVEALSDPDPDATLAERLEDAVDALNGLKVLLVLDNFEDVLDLSSLEIQHEALAAFYRRLMSSLTKGSRALITSRYLPAGTPDNFQAVRICPTLADFREPEFVKFLKREPKVAERLNKGDLSPTLIKRLFAVVGGTPRFLTVIRGLLKTYSVEQLYADLEGATGKIAEEREQYLREIFGPQLFAEMGTDGQCLSRRLALSELPLPVDGLAAVSELPDDRLSLALQKAVEYGLLQEFADREPRLYLPPGLWRPWLTAEERLPNEERTAAHGALSRFWKEAFEQERLEEFRVSVPSGLAASREHAKAAGESSLYRWGSLQLSLFLYRFSEFRQAKRVLQDYLEDVPKEERDLECLHALGAAESSLSNWAAARELYGQALAAPDGECADPKRERATVLSNLSMIDLNEGNYLAARENFGKALTMLQQIADRAGEAKILHNLATIDLREGKYPVARENLGKSLTIKQQVGDRAGEANTWHQLASIDLKEGNYPAARESFGKSLTIKQQIGDRAGEAATWHQLASIDVLEGNYPAARESFGKSLTIKQQIGDRAGEAATRANLASIDGNEGNYTAARESFGKALTMLRQIGDRAGEAATRANLASIDLNEGNYTAARENFGKALTMRQQIGDRAGEAATWHNLASIDLKEGNYTAARESFGKALTTLQRIGDRAGEAATWHQLASIDLYEGNYPAAREGFRKALTMRQQIGDRVGEAATFYQLGKLADKLGNTAGGAKLVGLCFVIDQAIGHGDSESDLRNFLGMCQKLGHTQEQVQTLLAEIAESHQQDGGAALLAEAFPQE